MNSNSASIVSQQPLTGNGCAGITCFGFPQPYANYGREYIQAQLIQPMTVGAKYYVEFNVSLADQSRYALTRLGCVFSSTPISNAVNPYLIMSPNIESQSGVYLDDKVNWMKITDYYIASGGEQYVTIGNFYDDSNVDTSYIGIGANTFAYYLIDDVIVVDSALVGIEKLNDGIAELGVYPSPASDVLMIENKNNMKDCSVKIADVFGNLIAAHDLIKQKEEVAISNVANGLYFLLFYDRNNKLLAREKIVVSH